MTEIYLDSPASGLRAVAAGLLEKGCRLAAAFAEDRRAVEGRDYVYYVFEQPGDPRYLLVRTPIPADDPAFPSVAAGIPAANWQEREIQDWFGLVAEGHPNPRRIAIEARIPRPVDLPHAAFTEGRQDFVGAEFDAYGKGHSCQTSLPQKTSVKIGLNIGF
jgi:NADH:ubiquinone oxidoreductase subunit C